MNKYLEEFLEIAKVLSYTPESKPMFDVFEGLYKHLSSDSEEVRQEYRFLYLTTKCLNYPTPEAYREVAEHYGAVRHNGFLCYLSDLAALRADPLDEKTYLRASRYARRFIEKGREEMDLAPENTHAVSVIMPTYNRGEVIRESMESVLKQDFDDLELVVVNDGGDDKVETIVDELNDGRIRYIKIEHAGLSGALNEGLRTARGEYIAYLDDDDIYYPDHLSTLIKVARDNKKDFVYSKSRMMRGIRDDCGRYMSFRDLGTNTLPYKKSTLATRLGISTLNVLHKRELVRKVGLFNLELPCSMDWDYWMRLSDIVEPYFVDRWSGEYRRTLDNMSSTNLHQGLFCSYHLLTPYYSTAYGALTLYKAASLQGLEESEVWRERLPGYFVSQYELLRSFYFHRRFIFDAGLFYRAVLKNKYRGEYSVGGLVKPGAMWLLSKFGHV